MAVVVSNNGITTREAVGYGSGSRGDEPQILPLKGTEVESIKKAMATSCSSFVFVTCQLEWQIGPVDMGRSSRVSRWLEGTTRDNRMNDERSSPLWIVCEKQRWEKERIRFIGKGKQDRKHTWTGDTWREEFILYKGIPTFDWIQAEISLFRFPSPLIFHLRSQNWNADNSLQK